MESCARHRAAAANNPKKSSRRIRHLSIEETERIARSFRLQDETPRREDGKLSGEDRRSETRPRDDRLPSD
jgi:hypothetical protein